MKLIISLFIFWYAAGPAYAQDPKNNTALVQEQKSRENILELIAQEDSIIGIEAIIAEAAHGPDAPIYSRFGHVLLRFVRDSSSWGDDPTLSFLANVDTSELSIEKGLFGGYSILMSLASFQETWNQYIQGEGRSLTRHIIPVTRDQIDRILQTLKSWSEHPEKVGDYKFLTRNCTTMMEELFEDAGLGYAGYEPEIPTHFPDWLVRSWLSPFPELVVVNPFGMLKKAAKLLGIPQEDLITGHDWPADSADRLLKGLDEKEIKILYRTVTDMPFDISIQIAKHVNYYSGQISYDQAMGMLPVPRIFYGICETDACFALLARAENQLFGKERTRKNNDTIAFWLRNSDLDFEYAKLKQDAFPGEEIDPPFNLLSFPSQQQAIGKREMLRQLIAR